MRAREKLAVTPFARQPGVGLLRAVAARARRNGQDAWVVDHLLVVALHPCSGFGLEFFILGLEPLGVALVLCPRTTAGSNPKV